MDELVTTCPYCGVEGRGIDPEVRHHTVYTHVEAVHPERVDEFPSSPLEE